MPIVSLAFDGEEQIAFGYTSGVDGPAAHERVAFPSIDPPCAGNSSNLVERKLHLDLGLFRSLLSRRLPIPQASQSPLRNHAVVEGDRPILQDLVSFMAFACQNHHVARLCDLQSFSNRALAIGFGCVRSVVALQTDKSIVHD